MVDLADVAAALLSTLEEQGLPAALAGGLAAGVWVAPKDIAETYDVDVAVASSSPEAIDPGEIAGRLTARLGVPCLHGTTLSLRKVEIVRFLCGDIQADMIVANPRYAREALGRSEPLDIDGAPFAVLSPEDAVLYKGLGRRLKDYGPIAAIARSQSLDLVYVERWARALGIWRFVAKALCGG